MCPLTCNLSLSLSVYDFTAKARELTRPLRSASVIKVDEFEARLEAVLKDVYNEGVMHHEHELVATLHQVVPKPSEPEAVNQRIDNLIKRIMRIEAANEQQDIDISTIKQFLKL